MLAMAKKKLDPVPCERIRDRKLELGYKVHVVKDKPQLNDAMRKQRAAHLTWKRKRFPKPLSRLAIHYFDQTWKGGKDEVLMFEARDDDEIAD